MQINILLETGIVIIFGFLLGEAAARFKLPKVSGYILAGILLNPQLSHLLSDNFADNVNSLIKVSLSFITFSIGGSLSASKIRSSGKIILITTIAEAMFAYIFVCIFIFLTLYFFFGIFDTWTVTLAVSLMLASLAAPTDPSATLAVTTEYHARGKVSSTILGIAAFDDIMGIILYTFTLSFAKSFLGTSHSGFFDSLIELGWNIGGAILLGVVYGIILNIITHVFNKEKEGALIVIILGILLLCYGTATMLGIDELLSTMALGAVVVNYNKQQHRIFGIIERYTDELIFVIFFTLSGLHLDITALLDSAFLIVIFVISRALGKFSGVYTATTLIGAPEKIRKYTAGGLFPQGGIVIGLALLLSKEDAFKKYSSMIIGIVIGAAVIHELFGPIISRASLKKAGEIK